MNNRTHTPLFHVAKRGALPWYKVWAIRGAGLLLALLVCSLITTLVSLVFIVVFSLLMSQWRHIIPYPRRVCQWMWRLEFTRQV